MQFSYALRAADCLAIGGLFIQSLDQNQLKLVQSMVRKELRARAKVQEQNNSWICGAGLVPCLKESIKVK